jgi:hypothetical protein
MKKFRWLKVLLILVATVVVGIGVLLTYVSVALPNVGPHPDMQVEITPARLERGAYLANNVMVCMECHSKRDWSLYAAPSIEGTRGAGGEEHDQRLGFPGSYVSSNITPYGVGDWTDGELFRAITSGVAKDGRALFPIMPHPGFGQLDENDITSVIAYLRSLEPIENETPESYSDFPMNFIINTIPQKATLTTMPDPANPVKYGEYLVTASSCVECHTRAEQGTFVGELFSGGQDFQFENGSIVRSANITSDPSGIGDWSKEQFIARFKLYSDSAYVPSTVKEGGMQTVMPWMSYSGMSETDLGAIYDFLMSTTPVKNEVERFVSAPTSH